MEFPLIIASASSRLVLYSVCRFPRRKLFFPLLFRIKHQILTFQEEDEESPIPPIEEQLATTLKIEDKTTLQEEVIEGEDVPHTVSHWLELSPNIPSKNSYPFLWHVTISKKKSFYFPGARGEYTRTIQRILWRNMSFRIWISTRFSQWHE